MLKYAKQIIIRKYAPHLTSIAWFWVAIVFVTLDIKVVLLKQF